jgi:hypothetical protein
MVLRFLIHSFDDSEHRFTGWVSGADFSEKSTDNRPAIVAGSAPSLLAVSNSAVAFCLFGTRGGKRRINGPTNEISNLSAFTAAVATAMHVPATHTHHRFTFQYYRHLHRKNLESLPKQQIVVAQKCSLWLVHRLSLMQ